MVYCTKCGTENTDDVENCSNCGASLNPPANQYRRRDWDYQDDCFGGRRNQTWPIMIGLFIILIGLSNILDDIFPWATWDNLWGFFLIAAGLMIVYNITQKKR